MDHSDSDCFLVAILTHGEDGGIVYAYDQPYELSLIWSFFTADNCPSLAGRPKIFVIQACRGNQLDHGVKVQKDGVARYSIPTHADFLFAYATIPGFMAFRNTTEGSWFINELCKELQENGHRYDINTLLTFVTQKVAYDHESVSNMPEYNMRKQTPCDQLVLLYLNTVNSCNRCLGSVGRMQGGCENMEHVQRNRNRPEHLQSKFKGHLFENLPCV